MNTKNLIKKNLTIAYQKHKKNNFKFAENFYKEVLKIDSNNFEANFLLGTLFVQLRKYDDAQQLLQKAIKIQPRNVDAHYNIGNLLNELGKFHEAVKSYEKAIQIHPGHEGAHNNLGNIYKELGKFKDAIKCYEKAIKINPNLFAAHNNLGIVFQILGKNQKAITCFQKTIQINSNFTPAHYNLGKVFKQLGEYPKAIKSFQNANTVRSRAELLESTYFSDGLKTYPAILKKFAKQDPLNLRVATLATYVAAKEKIKNVYPFCKNPLKYVFIKNLKNELTLPDKFSKNLSSVLAGVELIWEPPTKSTSKGYHTTGNLFRRKDSEILKLKKLIEKQINTYRKLYKSGTDHFITKWPTKSEIEGWHVKLLEQGYQKSHIHPAGWLSGVFYLKVPKLLKKNEGAIEFTFFGYDYPENKNLPNLIHSPKAFDIALFPSSLFHRTIPFNSKEERHVVAFDLIPK